jgi:tRNA-dihydrouridine synthase A
MEFHAAEHPIALQLGGSDPQGLAACAHLGEERGFDEINLNVGCPSDRVQSGSFGACLMATPELVAECVAAMGDAVSIDVTIKHRIGIDERDSYGELCDFVGRVAEAGCSTFIVHARKAWLQGLSPKENREIPPLQYPVVHHLKRDFPDLEIIINGGIQSLDSALEQLQQVDGVMIGRQAYQDPWSLIEADRRVFGDDRPRPTRHQVLEQLLPFVESEFARGIPIGRFTRHILGLFNGRPGARAWRRHISENAHRRGATPEIIRQAAGKVSP